MALKLFNTFRNLLMFHVRYPWITYGRNVHVQWSTTFWAPNRRIRLGNNIGIGSACEINSDLSIGNDVLIGSHVGLLSRNAHRSDIIGRSMFQSPRGDNGEIVIEDDVWIGFGAIILSGVRIGRGSVIGAGAVVTTDIPRYSIYVPSKGHVIGSRFSPQQIDQHEAALRIANVLSIKD